MADCKAWIVREKTNSMLRLFLLKQEAKHVLWHSQPTLATT